MYVSQLKSYIISILIYEIVNTEINQVSWGVVPIGDEKFACFRHHSEDTSHKTPNTKVHGQKRRSQKFKNI